MTIDLLCDILLATALIGFSCAWIWGIHGAALVSGLAGWFGSLPDALKKPIFDCPVCMPTVHVPIIYFASGAGSVLPWFYLFFVWIGSAGLNFVVKEYLYPEQ